MTDWQDEYKKRLETKSFEELCKIKQAKEKEIKSLDKRTYNGKMQSIFLKAELLVIQEILNKENKK